jgi:putative zinc finger/helix-turn-helix YgiT family protein
MKEICPICEKDSRAKVIKKKESMNVRGKLIDVEYEVFKCEACGEEYMDTETEHDPFVYAYASYRKKHNMLQPEEIKEIRRKYGLTQGELSGLLGWGGATLSRYENGALQDKTHDNQLKLLSDPRNMLKILTENSDVLREQKRTQLVTNITKIAKNEYPFERYIEEWSTKREISVYSGYKSFDLDKFINCILYFCKGGLLKTAINKHLFYADFKHFKEYQSSITGAWYVHLPYGPVPDNYEIYLATLVNERAIDVNEVFYDGKDFVGEEYKAIEAPILTLFSDSELKILATVKEHFKGYSAKAISDFSHEEKGYQESTTGQSISYEYAEALRI